MDRAGYIKFINIINGKIKEEVMIRAASRGKFINNLYFSTFLITFASVAIAPLLPCPAHTADSDTAVKMGENREQQDTQKKSKET